MHEWRWAQFLMNKHTGHRQGADRESFDLVRSNNVAYSPHRSRGPLVPYSAAIRSNWRGRYQVSDTSTTSANRTADQGMECGVALAIGRCLREMKRRHERVIKACRSQIVSSRPFHLRHTYLFMCSYLLGRMIHEGEMTVPQVVRPTTRRPPRTSHEKGDYEYIRPPLRVGSSIRPRPDINRSNLTHLCRPQE